jgi:hypothetical protein
LHLKCVISWFIFAFEFNLCHYTVFNTGVNFEAGTVSRFEFYKCMEDTGVMEEPCSVSRAAVDIVFSRVNWEVTDGITAKEEDNPDRALTVWEFGHSLLRMANEAYPAKKTMALSAAPSTSDLLSSNNDGSGGGGDGDGDGDDDGAGTAGPPGTGTAAAAAAAGRDALAVRFEHFLAVHVAPRCGCHDGGNIRANMRRPGVLNVLAKHRRMAMEVFNVFRGADVNDRKSMVGRCRLNG